MMKPPNRPQTVCLVSQRKSHSRKIRELAEDLFAQLSADADFPDDERADFVTSLVRQWITYDGNATFLLGDRQIFLRLARTPLGKLTVVTEPGPGGWMRMLVQDWKLDVDDVLELNEQLNRGQSAEAINGDGVPLRLWVNPQERTRGVEPLVKQQTPARVVRDYRKIAAGLLVRQFGTQVDPEEMDELVCSVVNQWQRFDGNAGIFVDGQTGYYFHIVERGDSMCEAGISQMRINVEAALQSAGLSPDALPEIITQLNLGQSVEFRNPHGVPSRLWFDPKARRLCIEPLTLARPVANLTPTLSPQSVNVKPPSGPYLGNVTIPYWAERATQSIPTNDTPPFSCPRCSAVLLPWREGQREQACALCGFTISLS